MKGENTLSLRIVHEESTEPISEQLIRALWDLMSASDPYDDTLSVQWYTVVAAGLLDMHEICLTHDTHTAVMAHGAALSASVSEPSAPNIPPVEFEI